MKVVFRIITVFAVALMAISALGLHTQRAKAADPVTITFWSIQFDADAIESVKGIIKDFEAANSNIKVKLEVRSTDAHKEAMRVAINTSAAPDVYFMWAGIGLGGFYVKSGGVEPLDEIYKQYKWEERFVPGALAGARFFDKYYGVPITIKGMGLYYRKDLFAKAGIAAKPTTYEELIAANEKLKAAGITPLSMGGKFNWMTMRLLDSLLEMSCGAKLHDDLKQMNADWSKEDCVTKAFTELGRWASQGYLPNSFLGVAPDDARAPLYQGKAAMLYDGDWLVPALKFDEQNLANWDYFPFPTGTNRLSSFTEMLFMTKTSQHKDESAKFIDFWTSPDVQTKYLGVLSTVSPAKSAKAGANQLALSAEWTQTLASFPGIYGPADQTLPLEIVSSFWKNQNDVIAGATKPADAGKNIQAEIDKYKAANK